MNDTATQFAPTTLQEAIQFYSDPDTCVAFMSALRWPDGPECPVCASNEISYLSTRRIWKCKACKKQFSVKVGTIMEDSAIGLDKWLMAIWMIANCKNGVSSYEIHRALGITQKSAWFLLHRIRLAMQTGSFKKMSGTVEVDETYIGGKARNMHANKREEKITGTGGAGKAIVMGILERGGRVLAKVVTDTKAETLQGEIRTNVRKGTKVMSDAHKAYTGLNPEFVHQFVDHATTYVKGAVHTNGLENFWSLLKRGIKGTYVSVEPFHLFRYVDEQAFRFNERKTNDASRFVIALTGITGKRLMYAELTGKASPSRS